MKKLITCLVVLISLFAFSANSLAATSIYFENIINGSFELEGSVQDDLSFQIIGADYLAGPFKLTAEYGLGKSNSSFEFQKIQAGLIIMGGGFEINDANLYLTASQINFTEENNSYSAEGTAFGLSLFQAHPVEAAGAFYIEQIAMEFAPKATYKSSGVETYNDVSILVGIIKARYQFTDNLSGILSGQLYHIKLGYSSTELQGFSLGIKYKF